MMVDRQSGAITRSAYLPLQRGRYEDPVRLFEAILEIQGTLSERLKGQAKDAKDAHRILGRQRPTLTRARS